MIKIKNVTKRFGTLTALNNISANLPTHGFVAIIGPSGCGKSTLLNLISGLDQNFEGGIYVDGKNIKAIKKSELPEFRLRNIGYVFQHFHLFNLENSFKNVSLPLDMISSSNKEIKKQRIKDIFDSFDIMPLLYKKVNLLSGGEKQRVAIARAIVNEPGILLCDEPTGSLDELSKEKILNILASISLSTLVVVVSHDEEIIKKFANRIICMKDGKIINDIENKTSIKCKRIISLKNVNSNRNPSIPFDFCISHGLRNIKEKKIRSAITNTITSIGLFGIGLSFLLSSSIKSQITDSFAKLIGDNQIVMSQRNSSSSTFGNVFAATLEDVINIKENFNQFFVDYGVTYDVNYENFFIDENSFFISSSVKRIEIPSISIRNVNEFIYLDNDYSNLNSEIGELENDQIVLGLNYNEMANICFSLKISRSFASLKEFVENNILTVSFALENKSWSYYDEQIFTVFDIIQVNESAIYHTNHLWNQTVFEDFMRFPTNENKQNQDKPWILKKIYYLKCKDDGKSFLDLAYFDEKLIDYIFERANQNYYPKIFKMNKAIIFNRILVFSLDKYCINIGQIDSIKRAENNLTNFTICSQGGYSIYPSSLMTGFSRNIFFSFDKNSLIEVTDADSGIESEEGIGQIFLPKDVLQGSIYKSASNGVKFSSNLSNIRGNQPLNNNQIALSSGFIKSLGINENVAIGKTLHIGALSKEIEFENTKIEKEYTFVDVVVVGIKSSEENMIYHDENWPISFFRDLIGISSFLLCPTSIIFETKEKLDSEEMVNKLNEIFKDYKFENPMYGISKSIDQTLNYVQIALIIFSSIAIIVSSMLLTVVIYINIIENKKDIYLLNLLGARKKDISLTFVFHGLISGFLSFLTASFEIFTTSLVLEQFFKETLMNYTFNALPYLVIFALSTLLTLLIGGLISSKSEKISLSGGF